MRKKNGRRENASPALRVEETIKLLICVSLSVGEMPNSNTMKSRPTALSTSLLHLLSSSSGPQPDIQLTNSKLSFCVRPCGSREKGSRAHQGEEDSVTAFKRTSNLERKTCHVHKPLEFSARDAHLRKFLEFRKRKSSVTVRMLPRCCSISWQELHGDRCPKPYVLTTQAQVAFPANICSHINPSLERQRRRVKGCFSTMHENPEDNL